MLNKRCITLPVVYFRSDSCTCLAIYRYVRIQIDEALGRLNTFTMKLQKATQTDPCDERFKGTDVGDEHVMKP